MSRLFLVTGIPAAGKSTVGHALARRFERGVCVDGDDIRKVVVSGADATRSNWRAYDGEAWDVDELRRGLVEQTPRVGLWLDNSSQSVEETVDHILERLRESAVSSLY